MGRMNDMVETQKILVVDDERINLELLVNLLSGDYQVLVAKNGRMALSVMDKNMPDLILLDIMMPEMDGYEVCRRLKENHETRDIPVIFLTARQDAESEARGFELGAVDYITKPFHGSTVRARVRTHLRLKRKADLLEQLAFVDGLTEIPNRRSFENMLEREWGAALRRGESISLVMIDVDMFKQYNDHYGHGAGDDCLSRVARALSRTLSRKGDFVARYGGEEFVAVLPGTGQSGAETIAEQLRAAVEALGIPHAKSLVTSSVTVSLGVATLTPGPGLKPDALKEAADRMLYEAKSEGRNRFKSTLMTTPE